MNPRPTKVARMTPLPKNNSSGRSQGCPEPEADDAHSLVTIRGRSTSGNTPAASAPLPRLEAPERVRSCPGPVVGTGQAENNNDRSDRPRGPDETQLDTTHEIRILRTMISSMENELRVLQSKWVDQLPDKRMLAIAQRCVVEKHAANQAAAIHGQLQQLFRQQQILFATMQTAALRLPLHSSGREMFEELHFNPHMGRDPAERLNMLQLHYQRSLATIPSIVKKFSQLAIDKAMETQDDKSDAGQSLLPLTQIDVTGCKDSTLISSVFISEIPNASLEEVYAGLIAYYSSIPEVVKRHFGIDAERKMLDNTGVGISYRRSIFKSAHSSWTVNNIFCSELTRTHGMVNIDVVTDDLLHPIPASASSHYCVCGVLATPRKQRMTGKTTSVMLRRIIVHRYNMLPHEPAVMKDVQIIRPLLNGELINASVCDYIQQLRRQEQSS